MIAERTLQRRLPISALGPSADDERAGDVVFARREPLRSHAGDDHAPRRNAPLPLHRRFTGDVDDRGARGQHDTRTEYGLLLDMNALDDDDAIVELDEDDEEEDDEEPVDLDDDDDIVELDEDDEAIASK